MLISGICTTPRTDIAGHILLGHAIDEAARPPLCVEHKRDRAIGRVTHLQYIGDDLHLIAEVDDPVDPAVLKLNYFSPGGRPLVRSQRGNYWEVTRFDLFEVSLVAAAANDRCLVLDRQPSDPMCKFVRTRAREFDLFMEAFHVLIRNLKAVRL
jgi:hypothetical protein